MLNTRIALALGVETTSKARFIWETNASAIDLVELRLDLMREYDLEALLRDRPTPVIVTNRPVREGGRYTGNEGERLTVLRRAAELGAEHIDCEYDSVDALEPESILPAKLIVSRHNFETMPDNFGDIHRRIEDTPCDIVKVVGMARTAIDIFPVVQAMKTAHKPTIAIAMGEKGLASRILAAKFGAYLTFVTPADTGLGTAPGQLSVEMLHSTYHFRDINADTAFYGCVAHPLLTQIAELNTALREAGKNAVVVPFSPDDTSRLESFAPYGFSGFIADTLPWDVARISES